MTIVARHLALTALVTTAACTSPEQIGDDAAECFEAKCDGFGGAEILGVLSDDVLENPPGQPAGFTVFGSKALFFGDSGRGLWITDGTPAGTTLIRDIGPLPDSDFAELPHIAVVGTKAMWTFQGAVWVTDGTPTGTTTVKDFGAARDAYVYDVMAFGERFLFHGEGQLWVSDGTPEGTSVLSDVAPGVTHMAMGGKLYFACSTPATGRELCVTDGTTAGTKVLADLRTGTGGIDPEFIGEIDGKLVFSAELSGDLGARTVCSTDGTTGGTQPLTVRAAEATVGAVFGDALYFPCSSKVCRTDGTAAGTTELVLAPGIAVSSNLVAANERLFFVAKTQATGLELWVTDGTAAGTTMLDIRPGEISGATPWLLALGDRVVVGASTANNEEELFISDGTVAGTVQVGDIQSGATSSYGLSLASAVVLGDKVIFAADDRTHGREPWVSDGTDAGTRMLADVAPPSVGARSMGSKSLGTGSYFAIEDGDATLVWRSNGAKEGTTKLAAIEGRVSPMFAAAGNSLYFAGDSSLWKTDGTPAGTAKVRDLPGSIEELTAVGNRLAFAGTTSAHSVGLWVSDGTAAGTLETDATNARRLGFASGRLWLTALGRGNQLFTSDGTVAGTTKVADINPTDDSEPGGFVGLGGKTVFSAIDGAGRELWITDGSVAGTQRISDIHPGAGSSQPRGMTTFKNRVLFWATTMSTARVYELYQTDGTLAGTTKLKAVSRRFVYTEGGLPDNFTVWGQHAFFVATDDAGTELWRTDGTEAGTVRVADIYAGPQPSNPANLVLAGPDGPLYFVAEEPAGGREPWKLATPTGTPSRLADVRPGPRSSKPSDLQPRGDALLFVAEGDNGPTLFRLGPVPDVIAPTIECPPDIELEATDANGVAVDFAAPTAADNDGDATIETSAATGDLFAVGTTTVTATATDRAGNTASCTFGITVTYMGMGGGSSGGETGAGDEDGLALDDQGGGCSAADQSGTPLSLGLLLFALISLRRRQQVL